MVQGSIPNGTSGIACQTIVNRMGELFGEFSFEFDKNLLGNDVTEVTKWGLRIDEEDLQGGRNTFLEDGEIPISRKRKFVKLRASSFYLAQTRVYNNADAMWGPWSDPVRAATMNPVRGKISEISEDYVRIQWDRVPRDMTDVPPERDVEGTQVISDITGLELLVLRESDMRQEFCEEFVTGVRAHTVHGLHHGTAYIVMIRYQTLINTLKAWSEVGRFYTQPSNVISLVTRGEDAITVSWKLGQKLVDTVGYQIPNTVVHRYELTIESETEANIGPIELPASDKEHRVEELVPGTVYSCYVRSLSIEGRWGSRSEAFQMRTADRLELSMVASGETFLSFTWVRPHDEDQESKIEYLLQSPISAYKQQDVVEVGPNLENKVFHLQNLNAGTEYSVSARTFLQGEWGLWSDPRCFKTRSKAFVSFIERGEDFFTMAFEHPDENTVGHFNIVVTQISTKDERVAVLDEEVVRKPEDPGFRVDNLLSDTVYEVKCRLWQQNRVTGFEGWGHFATPMRIQTLQQLGLHVWDLGEDFMQLVWRRGLVEPGKKAMQPTEGEQQWSDLKYEVVVGCVDTGEDEIVHRQVLETNYTITNLRPATTYIVSVRACNEFDQWGLWSKIKLRTLASVLTSVHEIGEDFVRLMWQRQNIDDKDETKVTGELTTADLFVSKYAVFVFAREDGPSSTSALSGYHMGGKSEVARYEVVPSEHTSLRVGELLHDREYVAVVRASTATGKWGLWSKPLRFRSNPQFRIPVNNLTIGENYVNLVWSRDGHPLTDPEVFLGDLSVTGQQLRIHGVDTQYSKDHTLAAEMRELKIYGLSPATAYTIQIRVCGKSGNWGLWSPPVHILTRDTILTKAVEVAEDYAIIAWERRKVANPKNYPTGRGVVTSYHLRVYNVSGIHSEVFLGDADCPYRISDLTPDTFYCVELKANYNDEEWGLWSTPLWCLSMKNLVIQTKLISEEFCCVTIKRPYQQKRLPEDDGNRASDDRILAFGQFRPNLMLCVTSPTLNQAPHTNSGFTKPRNQNSSLPPNSSDHRLIYQTEILCTSDDTVHTIPNLKSNTVYSTSVRSKLTNGEWGMWSLPPLLFATVPTTQVEFTDIGEKFIIIDWKRNPQIIPPQIEEPSSVACGLGTISASRVKVREIGGNFQKNCELQNSLTTLRVDGLSPATTYAVSVQTYNDNYEWGVWSEEGILRTIPGMDIVVQHVSEDAVWISWARKSDLSTIVKFDTVLNVDVVAKAYEVRVLGEGHFCFTKEMDTSKLFFRGLQPDSVYTFEVRGQSNENQEWGLWSSQSFRTKPRLRVTFGNVGEHFAIVEWRRYLPAMLDVKEDMGKITESPDLVQQFRLKVEQVGTKKPKIYDLSPYISNFRLKDLEPSAEYRVWLCAKGYEGVWGFWNDEARVRTLPKLELEVSAIGEDYVTVTWRRGKWMGETAVDSEASVREVDGAVSGYRVRVLDANGEVVATQALGFRETSCTLTRLNLSSLYSVEVSAKDTYNEWGLWSDPKLFATLEEVDMRILQVGEAFAEVEWGRQSALRRRGRDVLSCDKSGVDATIVKKDSEASDGDRTTPFASLRASSFGRRHNWPLATSKETENNENADESAAAAPTVVVGEDDYEEEEDYEYDFPEEALRGDAGVQQWQTRVHGHRVFGGQPGAEDFMEFFSGPENTRRIVDSLLPNATYAVSVRAQDKNGSWGHWSQPRRLVTYPLLELTADNITETFIHVSWSRPPMQEAITEGYVCFPPITDIHNYQVHIEPLGSEVPFDEKDEPLVNGARIYETSQPSLRLSNLTPGVRYRVVVCEQLINGQGVLLPDQWGSFSATTVVEMVNPMGVFPMEIGENYCHLGWHRVQRAPTETKSSLSVFTSEARITAFELRAKRLDEFALPNYKGPLALDTVVSLVSSSTSFQLKDLVSNTIYAVSVRAQTEGHWGPWSAVTKFVTLNRLQVHVHSVYEDTFAIGWSRPQPEWARGRRASTDSNLSSPSEEDSEIVEKFIEANDWNSVLLGDYSVELYELCLEGITCDLQRCLTLPGNRMSTRIPDLCHNQIYTVCIRSQSAKQHWSMFSRRESVLTLGPICVEVSHYTENIAQLRWFRSSHDVHDYADLLSRRRVEVERQCDERERHDLFTLKRRMQEVEAPDRDRLNDHQAIRREHNMAVRMDATHHLAIENVVLGDTAISSYQMRFFGEGCMPTVQGLNRILAHPQQQKTSRRRRHDGAKRTSVRQRRTNDTTHSDAPEDAMVLEDNLVPLIDVELGSQVATIVIKDLTPNMPFWLFVRARNVFGEWAPWSERTEFTTLRILELHHRRFGEHYINLYWHRLPIEEAQSIETEEHRLQELNEEFKTFSQRDLEARKLELTEEEYEGLIERLKSWRDLKRQLSQVRRRLESGAGEVIVHERTPIKGYQLRVIRESGSYVDYYIDNNDDTSRAFTVTKLEANTMYVVLLACDYGVGWGMWSQSLKFMTQNLIQLSLEYIAETFVDIEWHRATNKGLPLEDESTTLTSDTAVADGQVYQVRITYNDAYTGEEIEEFRIMRSCSVFRVDRLLPDTKYTFCVREWDVEGDWGLWCTPKTCVTLPGMSATVDELGEDWVLLSWRRDDQRVDYDDDLSVLQYGVENMAYYLMVQEVHDNDDDENTVPYMEDGQKSEQNPKLKSGDENAGVEEETGNEEQPQQQEGGTAKERDGEGEKEEKEQEELHREEPVAQGEQREKLNMSADSGAEDEMEGIFAAAQQRCGPLPPQEPPNLFDGECNGRFLMTRRFESTVTTFCLEGLRPDRFYSVRVMCETTGEQLGAWSADRIFVTMPKIRLITERIDEEYVDLQWFRPPPRQHPRLDMSSVFTGKYNTVAYVLEVVGDGGFHLVDKIAGQCNTSHRLEGLMLDTVYAAQVQSTSSDGKSSLWSETLRFATLNSVTVRPAQITECSIVLEWGREAQKPCGPDGVYDPTIQVGSRNSSNYLVRVAHSVESGRGLLLEKNFPGETQSFHLTLLTPNTPYVMCVRATNTLGEWGLWSMERCVYTMKLLYTDVAAVGEDYIRLLWKREEPDEVQLADSQTESQPSRPVDTTLGSGGGDDETEEQQQLLYAENLAETLPSSSKAYTGNRKKVYPLLDRPEVKSAVYNSDRTVVGSYAVSVMRMGDTEGYTIQVPGDATYFTVPSLRPDVRYTFAVRACYGSGEWGPYSPHVASGTHNLLAAELCGLGEDYLTAAWQRLVNSYDTQNLLLGNIEETLSYELAVHDFTDVPFGEEGPEHLPSRLRRTLFVSAKHRTATAKELLSNRRYMISVRRWYKPLEPFTLTCASETPNTDDEQILELLNSSNAMPGTWSDGLYAVTLRNMVCVHEDGAEEFFSVRWERDPYAPALPVRNPFPAMPVESYRLRIDEMTPDGLAVDTSAGSFHVDQTLDADVTTFQAQGLKPDVVYRVDVRSCVDRVWGRWSRGIYAMTLPKLVVGITSIGEDYAMITWQRPRRCLVLPDGTEVVSRSDENVDKFQLEVDGVAHSFHVSKKFKATRISYRVKQLEPNTLYAVTVRSCDAQRGTWSLWSERVRFATLKPLLLTIGPAAEQFVTVEWRRDEQSADEYDEGGSETPVLLGSPEIFAYHLCCFNVQQTPSFAVVDKQFPKDMNRFCLHTLTPDTPHAVIVRACNAESRWGLWSREGNFRTLRLLQLHVTFVGENYVRIRWEREEGDRSDEGPGSRSEPVVYQLLLRSGFETIERFVPHSDCSVTDDDFKLPTYVLDGLSPATTYLMALQPGYEENRWGHWTATVSFKTLHAINLVADLITADRINFALARTTDFIEAEAEKADDAAPAPAPADTLDAAGPASGGNAANALRYQLTLRRVEDIVPVRQSSSPIFSPITVAAAAIATTSATATATTIATAAAAAADGEGNEEAAAWQASMDDEMSRKRSTCRSPTSRLAPWCVEREIDVRPDIAASCLVDGLQSGTAYIAAARALDVNNMWGSWIELPLETAPLPPRAVSLRRMNPQFCLLQWEAPDNRHLYRYEVEQAFAVEAVRGKVREAADWRVVDTVEETTCRIRFTAPPGKMRCRVKCAKSGDGQPYSEFCEPVGLSSGMPPDPVANLTIMELSRNSVTAEWAPARAHGESGAKGRGVIYRVYLGVRDYAPILVTTTRMTSHVLSDLEPSTEYTLQVVAENSDGMSYTNPMLRVMTNAEHDTTVLRHDPERPPLGSIIEPLWALKRAALPEIPSATRQTFVPAPPANPRGKKRRRTNPSNATMDATPGRNPSISAGVLPDTAPSRSRGKTPQKKKREKLPSVRRPKS